MSVLAFHEKAGRSQAGLFRFYGTRYFSGRVATVARFHGSEGSRELESDITLDLKSVVPLKSEDKLCKKKFCWKW
jgi:hypothetical protein